MQISSFNLYAFLSIALATAKAEKPFIQQVSNSSEWIIGNDLWNITIGETYGTKLFYKDHDLIGDAVGHYAGYGIYTLPECLPKLTLDRWRVKLSMDFSKYI